MGIATQDIQMDCPCEHGCVQVYKWPYACTDAEVYCAQIYTPDQLNDLMAESDYVVAALPHTDKTEKLVSAEAISHMKKTGVFINIGRGQTVDEVALVKGKICCLSTGDLHSVDGKSISSYVA